MAGLGLSLLSLGSEDPRGLARGAEARKRAARRRPLAGSKARGWMGGGAGRAHCEGAAHGAVAHDGHVGAVEQPLDQGGVGHGGALCGGRGGHGCGVWCLAAQE
jgi:hypothetical protein